MDEKTQQNKTVLGVLAYLGPLVIISYALGNEVPFVKYHVKQGLVLFILEILIWALGSMFLWHFYFIYFVYQLANLVTVILAILGIINVVQNKERELPVIGQYAHSFKF